MSRASKRDEPKTSDLLIRRKVEAMIDYAYVALRQHEGGGAGVLEVVAGGVQQPLFQLWVSARQPRA